LAQSLEWLFQLAGSVQTLVDFGCWSSEPIALLWGLDATKATVVDRNEQHVALCRQELAGLRKKVPFAFEGRSVEFIVGDMTQHIDRLPTAWFDLAFCEDVLYHVVDQARTQGLREAIGQMSRVVKGGGYVIAVEPEFREGTHRVEGGPVDTSSPEIARLLAASCRLDLHVMFRGLGLAQVELAGAPEAAYCYRKAYR
jgi:SAM-dependent methyltransferase